MPEWLPPALLAALAAVFLTLGIAGMPSWSGLLTSLAHVGVVIGGLGVLMLVLIAWANARPARALGGHGHAGATEADLWRHENGHKRLLRKYGVGAGRQRVWTNSDGSVQGYTNVASWTRFDRLPVEKQVAIFAAGGIAMGSRSHDHSDDGNIRQIVKGAPWGTEVRGRAQARRDL